MGFFRKNKAKNVEPVSEVELPKDSKQLLDATRQNMIKIKDALDQVNVAEIRKNVPEDVVSDAELSAFDRDIKMIKAVIAKQTASQLVLAESEDLDKELLYFAEHIQEEMMDAHLDAANTYISAVKFGIAKGHEPIKESDMQDKDEIISRRLDIVKHYKLISDLHRKIALNRDSITGLNNKLEKLQREYTDAKLEAKDQKDLREDLYSKIVRMSAEEVTHATPEIQEFAAYFSRVTELKGQITAVKTSISNMKSNIQAQQRSISNTENALLSLNSITSEREREELERINSQYIDNMRKLQDEIFAFDEQFKELDASIEAINSDPRIAEKMVDTVIGFQDILRQDQEEEEAIAKGMENRRRRIEEDIEKGEAALNELEEEPQEIEHKKQLISN